jgi:hypothetical protein
MIDGLLVQPGLGALSSPLSPNRHNSSPSCLPDRFIPRRKDSSIVDLSLFTQKTPSSSSKNSSSTTAAGDTNDVDTSPAKQDYRNALKEIILAGSSEDKILSLTSPQTPPASPSSSRSSFSSFGGKTAPDTPTSPSGVSSPIKSKRRNARLIPKSPDKILDAPDIVDDYYLNLLDWSPSNVLAVGMMAHVKSCRRHKHMHTHTHTKKTQIQSYSH